MCARQRQNLFKKQTQSFWFSFALVLLFGLSLGQLVKAEGASLFLSPASKIFKVEDIFSIEVKINTAGVPINAAQATIYFPSDKLKALNISRSDSIFTLWLKKPVFSNASGEISFVGGLPTPGFSGVGNLITLNFEAKEEGIANLVFGEGQVLADDGKGTNILVFIKEAKYSIQRTVLSEIKPEVAPDQVPSPCQILSLSHPQQKEWYGNNSPQFQWELTPDIIGVNFTLDHYPNTIPDNVSQGKFQSKTYEKQEDGIWYFHLRTENKTGWSLPSHYKIQIDTHSPSPFEIIIDNEGDSTNPNPSLYFVTEDNTSEIDYYKLKIGKKNFANLMLAQVNPFPLFFQTPGTYPIVVRAMDEAGNGVEAKTIINIEPIKSPQITVWPKAYISGEETFYLEGTSLPEVEIAIFLKENEKIIKNWITLSNGQGEWSFSTKELIKHGIYSLSVQAKDQRGATSNLSNPDRIEVSLSGISFGLFMISFKTLVLVLFPILFLGIIIVSYFVWRNKQTKKILQKETWEAKESLHNAFDVLRKEIEARIELVDSQPGFNPEERQICKELKKALKVAEESVSKEIRDIEKGLR